MTEPTIARDRLAALARALRVEGHSYRSIAHQLGISRSTAARVTSGVPCTSVVGLDGKRYPPSRDKWRFTAEEVAQGIADAEPITDHTESARIDWLARLHPACRRTRRRDPRLRWLPLRERAATDG